MAKERSFLTRNVGTEETPIWEKWFAITVADAVMMTDADGESKTIVDYIQEKINALINGAPGTFDTLKEIADWIATHEDVAEALNAAIGNKVDKEDGKGLSSNDYTDEDKRKVNSIATNTLFTNSTPVVQAHGGVPVGQTFDEVPVTEVLNMILYPWVGPEVSATITTPKNGGTVEKGDVQHVTAMRVNVTKKSSNITKVEIFDGDSSLGSKEEGVTNGGQFDFTVAVDVSTNKGFQAKVTDAAGKTTNANTGSFTFVYPYYWGKVSSTASIDEATIEGLSKQIVSKGTKNVKYTMTNERAVFAYDKSYGPLKSIKDQNNFEVLDTFTRSEVSITGLDGTPVDYYVYVNSASTVSEFGMTFSY